MNASIDPMWLEQLKQVTIKGEKFRSHMINLDANQFDNLIYGGTNSIRVPKQDFKLGDSVVLVRTKNNRTTPQRCVALIEQITDDDCFKRLQLEIVSVYTELATYVS